MLDGGVMGISISKFALIMLGMGGFAILETFWIRMMLDNSRKNEGYTRYSWTLILAFTNVFGAIYYFFTIRRKRRQEEEEEE